MFLTRLYVGRTEGVQTKLQSQRTPQRLSSKTPQKRFYFLDSKSDISTSNSWLRTASGGLLVGGTPPVLPFVLFPHRNQRCFASVCKACNGDCRIAAVPHALAIFTVAICKILTYLIPTFRRRDMCLFVLHFMCTEDLYCRSERWCSGPASHVCACVRLHWLTIVHIYVFAWPFK